MTKPRFESHEVLVHLPVGKPKAPPLLFIHGAYTAAWCWEEHFLPFFAAAGYPAYAVSLSGHGASPGRKHLDSFSIADYVKAVATVVATLPAPPVLGGHSRCGFVLPKYREVILDKLERTAGMKGIRDRIATESVLTPEGIHKRYRVLNGAIYGLASHGKFVGAFKPANRSKDIEGLYLAGGAAHPGPGMPMVMMSGWIAADSLDQDSKKAIAMH